MQKDHCNFWKAQESVSDKMHTEFTFELFPDSFSPSISFHVYLKTYLEKKPKTQGRNSLVNFITCDLLESQLEGILVTGSCSQCKRQKTSERSMRTSNLWFLYPLQKTPSLESCRKQETSRYPHLVYTHLRKLFVFIWQTVDCIIEYFFNHLFLFIWKGNL